jgi:hypothetical protein
VACGRIAQEGAIMKIKTFAVATFVLVNHPSSKMVKHCRRTAEQYSSLADDDELGRPAYGH